MATDKSDDKRRFQRIFYHTNATLIDVEQRTPCRIIDLSLRGSLLEFDHSWTGDLGGVYTLTFELSDDVSITMEVSPTHVEGQQVGFRCLHIDIDSISLLRRLVELNLGDSDLLERDLNALSDIRA